MEGDSFVFFPFAPPLYDEENGACLSLFVDGLDIRRIIPEKLSDVGTVVNVKNGLIDSQSCL